MLKKVSLLFALVGAVGHACGQIAQPDNPRAFIARVNGNPYADIDVRTPAKKAQKITISLPQTASVADLLTSSKRKKHVGFNIPTMPHFTSRMPWSAAPWKMKSYKGYYKLQNGTLLTAASMHRFVLLSPMLFIERGKMTLEGKMYAQAIKDVTNAHKTWYADQTDENLKALQTAEDKIFTHLSHLPLSNPDIRMRVEKILSTDEKGFLKGDHNRFFNRAWPEFKKDAPEKWVAHQNGVFKTLLKGFAAPVLLTFAAMMLEAGAFEALALCGIGKIKVIRKDRTYKVAEIDVSSPILVATLLLGSAFILRNLTDWGNDYNLTPEPNGGITLAINLQPVAPAQS